MDIYNKIYQYFQVIKNKINKKCTISKKKAIYHIK